MQHRFKVGQKVRIRTGFRSQDMTAIFVIEKALPIEGIEIKYRIKCDTDTTARVVNEHDLVAVTGGQSHN